MNRAQGFVAVVAIAAIVLSLLFSPAFLVVAGVVLWIILWVAQGGMAEGNPYKRMGYSRAAPDFVEVKDFMKKEEIELRDRGSYETAVIVFSVGAIYIIIGTAWVLLNF
jgi:hypothetical protein